MTSVRSNWLVVFFAVAFASSLPAAAIRVPEDAATIEAGIDAASLGDTVLIACGEYWEYDLVLKPGISVQGATGDPDCVVVDAGGQGRVFLCLDADSTVSISGITLTGGSVANANGGGILCSSGRIRLENVVIHGNSCGYNGGGICCERASRLELEDVLFAANTAGMGGGICSSQLSQISLSDVQFLENSAAPGAQGRAGALCCWGGVSGSLLNVQFIRNESAYGGAMFCFQESHPALFNCLFEENAATSDGGAVWCDLLSCPSFDETTFCANHAGFYGGAAHYTNSSPSFTDVTFELNTATMGGAVFCLEMSHGNFDRVVFSRNEAIHHGGAIYCDASNLSVAHSTFVRNVADCYGGGIYCRNGSTAQVQNTILAFNLGAPDHAAVSCGMESAVTIDCSDVYGNAFGDWVGCIESQSSVSGNIHSDPHFCGADHGDYSLTEGSPCSFAQNPECGLIGALGVGCSATTTKYDSWGALKALYY